LSSRSSNPVTRAIPAAIPERSPTRRSHDFDREIIIKRFIYALALAAAVGCGDPAVQPSGITSPVSSVISALAPGIPFGSTQAPVSALSASKYDATLTPGTSANGLSAQLQAARTGGFRVMVAVPTAASKNADGTFSLKKWKAAVGVYESVDSVDAYAAAGVVIGHRLIDEPSCASCWGGQSISVGTLEQMARHSKLIWPTVPTVVRVVPSYFPKAPRYVDAAWAQWAGPRGATLGMTTVQFRDKNVADAKARRLALVIGMNVLNGGDGSSGIAGTREIDDPAGDLWQMTGAEVDSIGRLFAADPYVCAVLNWRYSLNYPRGGMTLEQYERIRSFDNRPEIIAAMQSVRSVAAVHAPTTCRTR
jgi:hypothetical protein